MGVGVDSIFTFWYVRVSGLLEVAIVSKIYLIERKETDG